MIRKKLVTDNVDLNGWLNRVDGTMREPGYLSKLDTGTPRSVATP